jgi:hypothetical protein
MSKVKSTRQIFLPSAKFRVISDVYTCPRFGANLDVYSQAGNPSMFLDGRAGLLAEYIGGLCH